MKQLVAVARLDIQRLSFPLLACALIAGLTPAFSAGLGSPAKVDATLAFALLLVGAAAGGTFGYDFAEGRGSFFFARPLSSSVIVGGRVLSVLTLAAGTFVAVMAANWLSTSDPAAFHLFILTRAHFYALAVAWTVGLHLGLAAAVQARSGEGVRSVASVGIIVLRVLAILSLTMLVFGLFADLVLRAYRTDGPVRLFFGSWVLGACAASLIAIVAGRTDRLRIAHIQNIVSIAVAIATSIAVAAVWAWVLNPGPETIRGLGEIESSPDGRFAYVRAVVDRGDQATYRPSFIVDLDSGSARLLKTDPFQGPWTSADGRVITWAEGTPVFFRPLLRKLGGGSHYRMQIGDAAPVALELPKRLQGLSTFGPAFLSLSVVSIMPSPDGDLYAVHDGRQLVFMSRTRGEFPAVSLPRDTGFGSLPIRFLANRRARTAIVAETDGQAEARIIDIEPETGRASVVASLTAPAIMAIRFNRDANRVIITTRNSPITRKASDNAASMLKQTRTGSSFLLDLENPGQSATARPLVADVQLPWSLFLEDGRIVTTSSDITRRTLFVSSADGALQFSRPLVDGSSWVGSEVFPNVISVVRRPNGPEETDLIDCNTGETLRTLKGFRSVVRDYPGGLHLESTPPTSTPGAHLLVSRDRSLYELPSLQAEPRLVLPRPRS